MQAVAAKVSAVSPHPQSLVDRFPLAGRILPAVKSVFLGFEAGIE
jgi:hypothetical protein